MPHLSLNKKDSGVSSVIGTITLLVLVVVATGIIAVNVVSNIGDTAQQGPIVSFEESADPTLLYHAGGDVLYWDKTIIYCNGEDITNLTYVGSYLNAISQLTTDAKLALDDVSDWSTGQFIRPFNATTSSVNSYGAIKVSEILIVSVEGGKPVVLYSGSEYKGGEKEEGYKITVTVSGNDPTSVSCPSRATADMSVQFTITDTPSSVTIVYGGSDGDININYAVSGNTYTFTMPSSDVNIFVDFTTAEYPYFRWGQNNSTVRYGTNYNSAKELIDAINEWQPNTIIQTKYTDDDNTVSGVIAKNIPLENQSLVIKTGWNINLTASSLNNISASPAHDKGVPLIVVQDHGSFNVYNGELVLDGAGRMKDSVVRVISGGNLTTKYENAVLNIKNGYNSSTTVSEGGGIYNKGTVDGKISVINCKAVNGGGIYNEGKLTLLSGTGVAIYGNTAQGNANNGFGGGIYNHGSSATADIYCNILFNRASSNSGGASGSGGGIANDDSAKLFIRENTLISGNIASLRGGGVYTNTLASTYIGGNIHSADGKIVTINNNSAGAGGGVYNYCNNNYGITTIYGGTFIIDNSAGGKFIDNNYKWSGGGIYNEGHITFKNGTITIQNNYCNSTKPDQGGGGISLSKSSTNNNINPIITYENAEVIVKNNYAERGGGVLVKLYNNYVINMTVSENTANDYGGGVYVYSGAAIINGTISNNTAPSGGGIYNNGTVRLNYSDTDVNTIGNSIYGNTAKTYGGGIWSVSADKVYYNNIPAPSTDGDVRKWFMNDIDSVIPNIAGTDGNNSYPGLREYFTDGDNISLVNAINEWAMMYHDKIILEFVNVNSVNVVNDSPIIIAARPIKIQDDLTINGSKTLNLVSAPGYDNDSLLLIDTNKKLTTYTNINVNGNYVGKSKSLVVVNGSAELNITRGEFVVQNGYMTSGNGGGIYNIGKLNVTSGKLTVLNNTAENGGGVYTTGTITNSDTLTVENNTATNGGGVYVNTGTITNSDTLTVQDNSATNGGGVYVNTGTITNSKTLTIHDNSATNGGGVYVDTTGTADIYGIISDNKAKTTTTNGYGGGVYVNSGTANIYGTVLNNTAEMSGGGIYSKSSTMNLFETGKVHNNSAQFGGGVYVSGGTVNINGTVSNNTATSTSTNNGGEGGGGIHIKGGGTVNVNGTVSNNTANMNGGGIYSTGSNSKVIIENGGKVMFNTAVKNGGGISFNSGDTVTVNGSVYNNTVEANANGDYYGLGGGVFINSGKLVLNNGKIYNNSALLITNTNNYDKRGLGGGIYTGSTVDRITINGNSEVSNNTATNYGGGILLKGTATVSRGSVLTMNYNSAKANEGSAIRVMSSGTFTNSGKITGTGNVYPQVVPTDSIGGNIEWK